MPDIITITDPGWNFVLTFWIVLGPAVALAVWLGLYLVSWILPGRGRKRSLREVANVFGFIGGIAAMFALLAVAVAGTFDYGNRTSDAQQAALKDDGYSDVIFTDSREEENQGFTSSHEGDYFRGALVEDGDLTWQVVQLVGAEK